MINGLGCNVTLDSEEVIKIRFVKRLFCKVCKKVQRHFKQGLMVWGSSERKSEKRSVIWWCEKCGEEVERRI